MIGDIVFTISATAPDVPPLILSPFVNVPVVTDVVNWGSFAFVEESADSKTPLNLNASDKILH